MSIKLRGSRNRRSYADYKPASRNQGPRNDPFRIVFYLVVIAAAGWALLNSSAIQKEINKQVGEFNPSGAMAEFGPTPTATPQPEQFAGLALEAYQAGNVDKAIEMYNQASDFAPESVEYPFQAARLMLFKSALLTGEAQAQALEDALEAANRVILANPEAPNGYAIYGKVLDWQGEPEQALSQIQRALDFDQNFALGHSYLSEALVDLQRWEQAQTSIEQARAIDPNNTDILRDYGYFLESQQDYVTAAAQYEAALATQPNQAYIMLALAKVYRVTGRYDESLDQLFAIDGLEPSNALVQFELGITYESFVGDPTSAQKYYEQATQSDPEYALPWIRLGTIHFTQGSYQQAIPNFEQAIKLGVTDQAILYIRLGMAYANQNRCDQAVVNLQKAEALVSAEDVDMLELITQGYKQCPAITPSPTTGRAGAQPSLTPTPR